MEVFPSPDDIIAHVESQIQHARDHKYGKENELYATINVDGQKIETEESSIGDIGKGDEPGTYVVKVKNLVAEHPGVTAVVLSGVGLLALGTLTLKKRNNKNASDNNKKL